MGHVRRYWNRSFALCVGLAVVALGVLTYALSAQGARILVEALPTDSTAIQLNADHIATWKEGGQQIFALRGNAVVSQGATSIRMSEAVVWIDMKRHESERVFHAVVYGDKAIQLEHGEKAEADFGYVRLATSNKVDIRAFQSKLSETRLSDEPLYQRAVTRRPANVVISGIPGPVQRAELVTTKLDADIQRTGGLQPFPPDPEPKLGPPPNFPPINDPRVAPVPDAPLPIVPKGLTPPAPVAPNAPIASPDGPVGPPPTRTAPALSIRPRYQGDLQWRAEPSKTEPGVTAVIVSGGVNLLVSAPGKKAGSKVNYLDIEADRLVIWTRGSAAQLFNNMRSDQGDESGAHEVYLSGHVELRTRTDKSLETLRADEVYYDFRRNVAVARQADFEIQLPKLAMPVHMKAPEIIQENLDVRRVQRGTVFSSILPSDPGLTFDISDATVETRRKERTYFWFFPAYDKNGERIVDTENIFTGRNMFVSLEGVPLLYFPYFRGPVEDPLGPLDAVNISYNNIFGLQVYTTWDMYDLLNLPHYDGTRWRVFLDYLTLRGPGFGTEFDVNGRDYFGIKGNYLGNLKLYGIFDKKADVLGLDRGNIAYWPNQFTTWPIEHPNFRGMAEGRINVQEMDNGFSVLGQFAFFRDRNFLEQYYLDSQLNDLNRDTYLRVKQQQGNWAWTIYGQISTREWLTETDWLPKADGYMLGQTFFDDLLVYNMHASAGYGRLRPTSVVPYAYFPTDVRTDAARLDLWQDISLPFYLGPLKLSPYLAADLAYYSNNVNGNDVGRFLGGAGVRGSIPFSRLYPDIQSDLFNLNGIDHKIVLTGNYYFAQTGTHFGSLPQLDRLNDDASDQALRDIRPVQTLFNPVNAANLTTNPLFNPQTYAIRRLIDTHPDTLDSIQVVQLGIRQRWQTDRGFPGKEHTIDWMTLNLNASIFPNANRDNFGNTWGILEYDWVWNIGDRTAVTSSGWFEPFEGGPRVFDVGGIFNRPDATNVYVGYRQIDPLNSKAVIGALTYPFSAKYAMSASTVWDFGNNVRSYGIFVSRMGTDVMINFGVNYNSTLNTFGVQFEMLPNLARRGRSATMFPVAANRDLDPLNQK